MLTGPPAPLTGRFSFKPAPENELSKLAALAPAERKKPASSKRRIKNEGQNETRIRNYIATKPPAIAGQGGHKQTFDVACCLVRGFDLRVDEAMPFLKEYNERCQPPWSDAELEHKLADAEKADGERGYLNNSTSVDFSNRSDVTFGPFDETDLLAGIGLAEFKPSKTNETTAAEDPPATVFHGDFLNPRSKEGRTDKANAKRLAKISRGKLRYVESWGKFIAWDGSCWRTSQIAPTAFAKSVSDMILADAINPPPADDNAINWGIKSASHQSIQAMIKLAISEPGISVQHRQLDADPWLLNCKNGIVDLRTGQLLPHDPAKLMTRISPVAYEPNAETYDWVRFLEKVFGNSQSMIDSVQRLIGYCATGSTREQIMPIFYGTGSNGKTTFLETIMAALGGDYSCQAPKEILIAKGGEMHPTALTTLHGRRFAVASETEDGSRLNESLIKQLTGSDTIIARRMKEDFWEFTPTHKLGLQTNHKPRVKGTDHGIWRRLALIPFTVRFWNPAKGETGPEELRRDETLGERLKKSLPGILSWIVRGAIDWNKNGLSLSPEIDGATNAYRTSQNLLGRFFDECCETGISPTPTKFSQLFSALEMWADQTGENRPSRRAFGTWLQEEKGLDCKRSNGETWYFHVALKSGEGTKNEFEDLPSGF